MRGKLRFGKPAISITSLSLIPLRKARRANVRRRPWKAGCRGLRGHGIPCPYEGAVACAPPFANEDFNSGLWFGRSAPALRQRLGPVAH